MQQKKIALVAHNVNITSKLLFYHAISKFIVVPQFLTIVATIWGSKSSKLVSVSKKMCRFFTDLMFHLENDQNFKSSPKIKFPHSLVSLYFKLYIYLIHHVHYKPCIHGNLDFWIFEILKQYWQILWILKVLKFHMFKIRSVFLVWLIFFYHPYFFLWKLFYYMSPFNNALQN
jgi:hypothetical protein